MPAAKTRAERENFLGLLPDPRAIDECHSVSMGRLRLGQVRPTGSILISTFLLTFGLSWIKWFYRALNEVTWHMYGQTAGVRSAIRAAVPGLHFSAAYRLACLIREAERQNHYASTSPMLAATLAILPPLSSAYLQRAMNAHWRLHGVCNVHFLRQNKNQTPAVADFHQDLSPHNPLLAHVKRPWSSSLANAKSSKHVFQHIFGINSSHQTIQSSRRNL